MAENLSKETVHEEQTSQYDHLPVNKPRHLVFFDETIGRLIKVARLEKLRLEFQVDTPEGAQREEAAQATVVLKNPDTKEAKTYKGKGPSTGHALREMLDRINLDYPLGQEYEHEE